MATAFAVPISEIQKKSWRVTRLCREQSPWRVLQLFLALPKTLRFINKHLSGEALGNLDIDQARTLYEACAPLYGNLCKYLAQAHRKSFLSRLFAGWWFPAMYRECDLLGDAMEALAWGADPELRSYIDSSIATIEGSL